MPAGLPKRLRRWFPLADEAGRKYGVDPLLVLAVMDRESLGGEALKPKGPAGVGDKGHGRGLMQVDDRYHKVFVAELLPDGTPAWASPARNIDYGTSLLHDRLVIFHGEEALAVASYNASVERVQRAVLFVEGSLTPEKLLKAADITTTGRNYASDVLTRRDRYRRAMAHPEES